LLAFFDHAMLYGYRSIKGNQDTLQFGVYAGVASFVLLVQEQADFYAVGIVKGLVPINNTDGSQGKIWLSTPYYYVDHVANGNYFFQYFSPAPLWQTHQYMIFLYNSSRIEGTPATMYAFIDATTLQTNLAGFSNYLSRAEAVAETHNTYDQMNSHFLSMKAGELWLLFSPFEISLPLAEWTYKAIKISETECNMTGP
jgi:hypothetical protein